MSCQIVVSDSSSVVFLHINQALEPCLSLLPYEFGVAVGALGKDCLGLTAESKKQLKAAGLKVLGLTSEQVMEARDLQKQYPGIAALDSFSLTAAKHYPSKVAFVTDDATLKRAAERVQLPTRSLRWVLGSLSKSLPSSRYQSGSWARQYFPLELLGQPESGSYSL